LLRAPFPCDHIIQFYNEEEVLIRALARFVGSGLELGEAVVVIATADHLGALAQRLARDGRSLPNGTEGVLVSVDAERCLDKFMVDGMPDRAAFRLVVTATLDRLRNAGYGKIRLFGEMVNLLWQHNDTATVRLEELWNEVVAEYRVCLLCAYQVQAADAELKRGLLHQITSYHSYSCPENYLTHR
jgi:hypothetical protein